MPRANQTSRRPAVRQSADTGDGAKPRREVIMEAAARVMATKGFPNATIRDIGAEAGLLSGSLYYYFDSKDAMLEAILVDALDELTTRYGAVANSIEDPASCLRGLIVSAAEWIQRNQHQATVLQNDFGQVQQSEKFGWINEKYLAVRQIWTGVLSRGVEAGVFKADLEVELAYLTIYGSLLSTVRWYDPSRDPSLTALAVKQADMFLTGLCV